MKSLKPNFLSCILLLFVFLNSSTAQWVQVKNGMSSLTVNALASIGSTIFAGTDSDGLYISTDDGITWAKSSLNYSTVRAFTVSGNNIFAGVGNHGVFLSTDNGLSWVQTSLNSGNVKALTISGNYIIAGLGSITGGVYVSSDNGTSWTQTPLVEYVNALFAIGNTVFAGTYNGTGGGVLYVSTDIGASWRRTNFFNIVYSFAFNDNYLFAGTNNGVLKSSDGGLSWIYTAMTTKLFFTLACEGHNIYGGTLGAGTYFSQNNGQNWTLRADGLTGMTVYDIKIINSNIYAASESGLFKYEPALATIFEDNAENGFGNWVTNQGWSLTSDYSYSPVNSFTDSRKGNYRNNADNSITLKNPLNMAGYDNLVLNFWHIYDTQQGHDFCRVEVSSDNGNNWREVQNFSGSSVPVMRRVGIDITDYVNNSENVKVRFRLTSDKKSGGDGWYIDDIKITGITAGDKIINKRNANKHPEYYVLSQNYPNPFNPSTTIKFSLPKSSFVKLIVYDVTGKEVQTLVNENLNAGTYSVNFDGSKLSSGVYYYKIDGLVEVKKMILIK